MRKVGAMTHAPLAALVLDVVEGPDVGRSFRFSREATVILRRRSDPDDDGLSLRTDETDAVHVVLVRTAEGWTFERRAGPLVEVDGVSTDRGLLRHGATLRIGGTRLEVACVAGRAAAATVAEPAASRPDPRVGGFECIELVAGDEGTCTWLARRTADGVPVALKVVRDDAGEAARRDLRRAAEIAGLLVGRAHAAQLVGADPSGAPAWLALRWVDGESVEDLVDRAGPLGIADACAVGAQILGVLDGIHAGGFVHRDVHPGNVIWSDRSAPGAVDAVLIDFGLGKAVRSEGAERTLNPTRTGEWMGRPRFLAPEQALDGKHVGPAADLYGLAATIYWLLCRAPVHREQPGESALSAWTRGHRVPIRRRRADLPESLAVALDGALTRDPGLRGEALPALRAEFDRHASPDVWKSGL